MIYKICEQALWRQAQQDGHLRGGPADLRDGFIHVSTAGQLGGTAAKHFAGASDLILLAVEAEALGAALQWEPSRGGDLFPHLYAPLPVAAVRWAQLLESGPSGPVIPELAP